MRLIIATVFFWLCFVSAVSADVIFDKDLFPRRTTPRPPRRVEVPLPKAPEPIADPESWHPNAEPDPTVEPGTTPEEAGFAIVIVGAVIVGLSVRESRRRPLQRRAA
jgi:hypothetical protein